MNLVQRCRMLSLGVVLWMAVAIQSAAHYPLSSLSLVHAALAGMVVGGAFVPRTMLNWGG